MADELGALTHQSARDRLGALARARNDAAWVAGALESLDAVPGVPQKSVAKALRALERVDALLEGLEREVSDV